MNKLIKYSFTLASILISLACSYGQGKRIYYQIPPKADSIVSDYINKVKSNVKKNKVLYAVLEKENEWYTLIVAETYRNDDRYKTAISRSARTIRLQNRFSLPVFLSGYDDRFLNAEYGYTDRGEFVFGYHRTLYHSFFIVFNTANEVKEVSYSGW